MEPTQIKVNIQVSAQMRAQLLILSRVGEGLVFRERISFLYLRLF